MGKATGILLKQAKIFSNSLQCPLNRILNTMYIASVKNLKTITMSGLPSVDITIH